MFRGVGVVVVRGVQMFSGLDPKAADWRLRRVTSLCGLTLDGGVEQDHGRAKPGAVKPEPTRDRSHLRLVGNG